ncbi:MAG: hydrogenase expression/formation protein HypE [Phycisphaerales bacterium]|nr:MAG: hydrogenase expression/formation protein HypE [Phycisphaerales bacterium]
MTRVGVRQQSETCIVRAHGGGGELMNKLISEHIISAFGNTTLNQLTDGAVLPAETSRVVITTDSYVVDPLQFPGGDIGRLAVCGTVNDLAVMGARPLGLSLGLIVEEGFELARLDQILSSVAKAAHEADVRIVTGDTKVIEHSGGSGIFINTSGVGSLDDRINIGLDRVEVGDAILVNGTIGDHGMAVMSVRSGLEFDTDIRSDAAPLNGLIHELIDAGVDIHFMRDATRGGLAAVLVDICEQSGLGVEVDESELPRDPIVRAAAEVLGFDLLTVANEGKVVAVVPQDQADMCLGLMTRHTRGRDGAIIGRIVACDLPLVELVTESGGRRVVQRPYGEELPRIC